MWNQLESEGQNKEQNKEDVKVFFKKRKEGITIKLIFTLFSPEFTSIPKPTPKAISMKNKTKKKERGERSLIL